MTGEHFVFVESNTTGTGAVAVRRLLEQGVRVSFFTRSPEKYPFLSQARAGLAVIETETNDVAAVFDRFGRLADEPGGVDAVLTFSEFYVPLVAEVAKRWGLPFLSPGAARTCRNKSEARKILSDHGLPVPRFRTVRSVEEAERCSDEMSYPCVVKPPSESSSTGVRQVETPEEMLDHFRLLHARRTNERGQELRGEVLVESLLEGPEISVETVTFGPGDTRVVGITGKHLSAPPRFVETGHDFLATLTPDREREAAAAAIAALDAVGFDFGPAHTELRWTETGPVVIEINPRLAGGMIPELVRLALGIDLLQALLDQLRRRRPRLEPVRHHFASIRFLTARLRGRLENVEGQEEARRLPTVHEIVLSKEPGSEVVPAESALDRVGYVITAGAERESVVRDAEDALDRLTLRITPSGDRRVSPPDLARTMFPS